MAKKLFQGKPINTSVPSIAIRFHANAEEIEELYQSEDESSDKLTNEKSKSAVAATTDPESSPLRSYLRLGKRSTSIDNSLTSQDSSPPSDPWKFFHEIRGKITKSVEDTITEIKHHRNQEGGDSSTKKKPSKDNSSLSDSEDQSESSLSKTCGALSTTEGVEMSSDDETPSLEKDKLEDALKQIPSPSSQLTLRQRIKGHKKKKLTQDSYLKSLANLYELNTGIKPGISNGKKPEEVESGVEAFEDVNLQTSDENNKSEVKTLKSLTKEEILSGLTEQIENFDLDEKKKLNVKQITGSEIRDSYFKDSKTRAFFAPKGFVDFRIPPPPPTYSEIAYSYKYYILSFTMFFSYFYLSIPDYVNGFCTGTLVTLLAMSFYYNLFRSETRSGFADHSQASGLPFLEIPAIKEYQPVVKFEGWMNEYPEDYNPETYHISQTQSIYVKLQGNLLRISHTRSKIPKRAMWNESNHKLLFIQHRLYNLLGAKVHLLPEGLNKKRHWSKKYPICITLDKHQMDFSIVTPSLDSTLEEDKKINTSSSFGSGRTSSRSFFSRKKKVAVSPQIFSKLTEESEEVEIDRASSSSVSPAEDQTPDISEEKMIDDEDEDEEDDMSLADWGTFNQDSTADETSSATNLYLFGRTGKEKEDWFRRFAAATHRGANLIEKEINDDEVAESISNTLIDAEKTSGEYLKFMAKFHKTKPLENSESSSEVDVLWMNALIGRILFDCTRDEVITNIIKERIQRKLSSIKLPYFIEQLLVTELSLGNDSPLIHKASKPILDQRGLWIDLDLTYKGNIVLILQTKLNLMKLKQNPTSESTTEEAQNPSAKWLDSDVEDTAESSTDDDLHLMPPTKVLDDTGNPVVGLGGSSNTSKKFIKMVDKIAESKFFQAATENRYIKKAMEGVSNTDLRLKVEVKGLIGTLVLNIPPPPSDRIWVGFRPVPKLNLTAHPIVGERNMSFLTQLTNWIEKKLSQEFQKVLVIPNMEDILIPVMSQNLPS